VVTQPPGDAVAVRIETAARLLDATQSQVRHWIKTGALPAFKLGRGWRIRRADIDALRQEARAGQ